MKYLICLLLNHNWKFYREEERIFTDKKGNKIFKSIIKESVFECQRCSKIKREATNWDITAKI